MFTALSETGRATSLTLTVSIIFLSPPSGVEMNPLWAITFIPSAVTPVTTLAFSGPCDSTVISVPASPYSTVITLSF